MKIISNRRLRDFDFCGEAAENREYFLNEEMDVIENILENEYPDELEEDTINDIFHFESDWLAQIIGYSSFNELVKKVEDDSYNIYVIRKEMKRDYYSSRI